MVDEPIIPRPESAPHSATVIDLAGVRVQYGLPDYRDRRCCGHRSLVYSSSERRIWCDACKRTIDNYDAFAVLVTHFGAMVRAAETAQREAQEALAAVVHRRAAKQVDRLWSGHQRAIGCPHCRRGILPEDWANGPTVTYSRDYELARRGRDNGGKP